MSQIESTSASSSGATGLQKPSRRKIFAGTKTNKLKSFKGFITGKSRRERRAAANRAVPAAISEESKNMPEPSLDTVTSSDSRANDDRENETVYGMELDNASTFSTLSENVSVAATTSPNTAFDLVMLLMDSETKRFELMQVDVDSPAALVKDILVKIPEHATEPSLKNQVFNMVCDRYGKLLETDKALADYFSIDAEGQRTFLLLAVTSKQLDLKGSDCAKLAKPILTHPKISTMLHKLGVVPDTVTPEDAVSAMPSPIKEPVASPVLDDSSHDVINMKTSNTEKRTKSDASSFMSRFLAFVLVISASAVSYSTFLQVHTFYRTAPLTQPGHILAPGSWRSQCGLFHLLPSKITSEALCPTKDTLSIYMSSNGTTLQVYRDTKLIYALVGESCDLPSHPSSPSLLQSFMNVSTQDQVDSCTPGARVSANGSIEIGGRPPLYATTFDIKHTSLLEELQSWPFAEKIHVPFLQTVHQSPSNMKMKKPKAHGKPKNFKFPWENIKIVWPWEKNHKK